MGYKKTEGSSFVGNEGRLPTPETDKHPILTAFVNAIGDFYEKSYHWDSNAYRVSLQQRNIVFDGIAKYLNDSFIETLRRELKLPKK